MLVLDIPAANRSYRLVAEPSAFRVTSSIVNHITHRRHATRADAIADLLTTLIADGNSIVQPLCDEAAALKAGWEYGRPGFPAGSGVLKRLEREKYKAFETTAMEFGRAVTAILETGGELPAWMPIPAWLAAALEEVEVQQADNSVSREVSAFR